MPGETQDTAFMFVPSESIFADIHERFEDIVQRAHRARIVIVSPSLLMLSIQVVTSLLRDQRMREQAHVIQQEVAKLMEDVGRLDDRVKKLQMHFGQANKDVEDILSLDPQDRRRRAERSTRSNSTGPARRSRTTREARKGAEAGRRARERAARAAVLAVRGSLETGPRPADQSLRSDLASLLPDERGAPPSAVHRVLAVQHLGHRGEGSGEAEFGDGVAFVDDLDAALLGEVEKEIGVVGTGHQQRQVPMMTPVAVAFHGAERSMRMVMS